MVVEVVVMVMLMMVMMVMVLLPEYCCIQDLLDPLTVQTGLPAAPD